MVHKNNNPSNNIKKLYNNINKSNIKNYEPFEYIFIKKLKNNRLLQKSDNATPPLILPKGWNYIDVPGDGTCGFHAIVQYYQIMGWKLPTFPENTKNLKSNEIVTNEQWRKGFILRDYLSKKTLNAKNFANAPLYFTRKIKLNESIIYENILTKNNLKSKFNRYTSGLSNTMWMDDEMLFITAQILGVFIFVWSNNSINYKNYRWTVFTPFGDTLTSKNITPNKDNSIFLVKLLSHYMTLIPFHNYDFKDRFTIKTLKNNNLLLNNTNKNGFLIKK